MQSWILQGKTAIFLRISSVQRGKFSASLSRRESFVALLWNIWSQDLLLYHKYMHNNAQAVKSILIAGTGKHMVLNNSQRKWAERSRKNSLQHKKNQMTNNNLTHSPRHPCRLLRWLTKHCLYFISLFYSYVQILASSGRKKENIAITREMIEKHGNEKNKYERFKLVWNAILQLSILQHLDICIEAFRSQSKAQT